MKRRFCFTLVEILVVTALVALLGAIGFAGYGYAMGAARRSATESLLKQMEAALENFKIKKGYYPSLDGYSTITLTLDGDKIDKITFETVKDVTPKKIEWAAASDEFKTFIKPLDQEKLKKSISGGNLVDSWGGKILYRYPGKVNKTGFDLIAPGPDDKYSKDDHPFDKVKEKLDDAAYTDDNGAWACDDIANFMNK